MSRTVVVRRSTPMRRRVVWSVMRRLFFTNFLICWHDFEFGPDARVASLVPLTCDLRVIFIFWWGSAVLQPGLCPLCIVLRERSEHCSGLSWERLGYIKCGLDSASMVACDRCKWSEVNAVHAHQSDFHGFNSGCRQASSYFHISFWWPLCQHWHLDSLLLPSETYQCFSALLAAKVEERQATMSATLGLQHTAAYCSHSRAPASFSSLRPEPSKGSGPRNLCKRSRTFGASIWCSWAFTGCLCSTTERLQPGRRLFVSILCVDFIVIHRGYLSLGSKSTSIKDCQTTTCRRNKERQLEDQILMYKMW